MGTTKVTVRRTAKKKTGTTQGTVKTSSKTTVSPEKVATKKARVVAKKKGS